MGQFLAERYVAAAEVAREAALLRKLTTEGRVHLLHAVYVPEDELCFFLFESDSAAEVGRLAAFDRISPAATP